MPNAVLILDPAVAEGYGLPRTFPLRGAEMTIGRHRDNAIQLAKVPSVSRNHARLSFRGGTWTITNESATNTVKVNGNPVAEAPLSEGDWVELGEAVLRFTLEAPCSADGESTAMIQKSADKPYRFEGLNSAGLTQLFEKLLGFLKSAPFQAGEKGVLDLYRSLLLEHAAADRFLLVKSTPTGLISEEEVMPVEYSRSIIQRAFETGEAFLWLHERPEIPTATAGALGIRSALAVPVSVDGDIPYVIYMHRTRRAPYTESDLDFCRASACIVSVILENQHMRQVLTRANDSLPPPEGNTHTLFEAGPATRQLVRQVRRFASSDIPLLLLGETGTGKEIYARALHDASPRRDGSFVAVNCAAIPNTLLESELFGFGPHSGVTGAPAEGRDGKIQASDRGTLFLDEIGDLPLELQGKLLRVLEEKSVNPIGQLEPARVDFRLVCATNQDLRAMMQEGSFRPDLYYRIRGDTIAVPPLRERREEILPLARHFAEECARKRGASPPAFSEGAESLLENHDWRGNVRELRLAVESAVALAGPGPVERPHFPGLTEDTEIRKRIPTLEDVLLLHVHGAYRELGENKSLTAEVLGVGRNTVTRYLRKYEERHGTSSSPTS